MRAFSGTIELRDENLAKRVRDDLAYGDEIEATTDTYMSLKGLPAVLLDYVKVV